jgi:hypothetical protein
MLPTRNSQTKSARTKWYTMNRTNKHSDFTNIPNQTEQINIVISQISPIKVQEASSIQLGIFFSVFHIAVSDIIFRISSKGDSGSSGSSGQNSK